MNSILKINTILKRVEMHILILSVLMMAVLLVGNVIMRFVFNNSLSFTEEASQVLIMIVTFIGISYVASEGKHIRMSIIYDKAPFRRRKAMATVISITTSAALFWLTFFSFQYTLDSIRSGRVTAAMRMPIYLVVAVITLGLLSAAIQYLLVFIMNIKNKDIYVGLEPESEV